MWGMFGLPGMQGAASEGAGAQVPEGFPTEVPLPPAKLKGSLAAATPEGGMWLLTYGIDPGTPVEAVKAQAQVLKEAGFTTPLEVYGGEGGGGTFVNGALAVVLAASGTELTLMVTRQS